MQCCSASDIFSKFLHAQCIFYAHVLTGNSQVACCRYIVLPPDDHTAVIAAMTHRYIAQGQFAGHYIRLKPLFNHISVSEDVYVRQIKANI